MWTGGAQAAGDAAADIEEYNLTMAKRKRSHQVSHAQRFLPRNRNPGLMATAEAKAKMAAERPASVSEIVAKGQSMLIKVTPKPKERPKLMTPAELTAERWKVSRPKPLVIG